MGIESNIVVILRGKITIFKPVTLIKPERAVEAGLVEGPVEEGEAKRKSRRRKQCYPIKASDQSCFTNTE